MGRLNMVKRHDGQCCFAPGPSARMPGGAFCPAGCAGRNCPGFSGEQSAERTSRKLEGRDPCRRESTPRGNQPNSACAEFGCSKKIVPAAPATPRNTETHPTPKLPNCPAPPKKEKRARFESQISLEVPARSSIMVAPSQQEMRDRNSSRNNLPASSGRPRPSSGIPVRHFKPKILMSSKPLREKLRIRADATADGGSHGPVVRCRCRAPARQFA